MLTSFISFGWWKKDVEKLQHNQLLNQSKAVLMFKERQNQTKLLFLSLVDSFEDHVPDEIMDNSSPVSSDGIVQIM